MSELPIDGVSTTNILDQVCDLFEGGELAERSTIYWIGLIFAAALQASKGMRDQKGHSTDLFNDMELEWFIKNSYNSALKYYGESSPQCIIRLLEACISVNRLF